MLNSGPIAKKLRGHFGSGSNYTDEHIEVPVSHTPTVQMAPVGEKAIMYEPSEPTTWIRGYTVEVEE